MDGNHTDTLMIVGVLKEIKNHEYRVGLTPACVGAYVSEGHEVLVQEGAGLGSGFEDAEYAARGAKMNTDASEVWNRAGMIVKVKEPIEQEYRYFRKDLILYTYLHLAADRPLTDALLKSGVKAIAYETIQAKDQSLPCLQPMSAIAGRLSIQEGAKYLEKPYGGRGVLLGGVPGVKRANITVIGGGIVGTNACKMAVGLGGNVTVLDTNIARLAYLDDIFGGRITTLYNTKANLEASISQSDLVIGSVLIPGKAAPKLVTKAHLSTMKKGAVIVDVAVDQGGCFETTRPTTHQDPTFVVDGIVHYCVANMPGAVPRTSTLALTNATTPYGLIIAKSGIENASRTDAGLASGINCYEGKLTCSGVAEAFGMELTPVMQVIA